MVGCGVQLGAIIQARRTGDKGHKNCMIRRAGIRWYSHIAGKVLWRALLACTLCKMMQLLP